MRSHTVSSWFIGLMELDLHIPGQWYRNSVLEALQDQNWLLLMTWSSYISGYSIINVQYSLKPNNQVTSQNFMSFSSPCVNVLVIVSCQFNFVTNVNLLMPFCIEYYLTKSVQPILLLKATTD
jgi:hypothetical protein